MRNDDAVVRLAPLGGQWEQIGTGAWRGYTPESIVATSNKYGPDTLTFTLKRDPRRGGHNDLKAFTPVEFEVSGVVVWEGYIWETPTQAGADALSISVSCRGWQYTLDDTQVSQVLVRSDLSTFVDARSSPGVDLSRWPSAASVSGDGGAVVLTLTKGMSFANGQAVGVITDLGVGNWVKRIEMQIDMGNPGGGALTGLVFYVVATDTADPLSTSENYINGVALTSLNTLYPGTYNQGSISGTHRYVSLFVYNLSGSTYTPAGDITVRLNAMQLVQETAYDGALFASTVLKDLITRGNMPLLSTDTTGITSTAFNIPSLDIVQPRTTREIVDAVNAFHNYRTRVGIGKRFLFQAQPNTAVLSTRDMPGSEFSDSSANVAEELFNRVVGSGTGADGSNLQITRSSQQSALATQIYAPSSPAIANGTLDSAMTGWTSNTIGASTWAWTGGDGSPNVGSAAVLSSVSTSQPTIQSHITGPFIAGRNYTVKFNLKVAITGTATSSAGFPQVTFGNQVAGYQDLALLTAIAPSVTYPTNGYAWASFTLSWTPQLTWSDAYFTVTAAGMGGAAGYTVSTWLDTAVLYVAIPTLLDRWGRFRTASLSVESAVTTPVLSQLCDVFLTTKARTPFKGSWKLTGEQSAWFSGSDARIHPAETLLYATEMVRFMDLIDPDTGGVGREGIISQVSYDHPSRTASIDIDNTRSDFEALLGRLAAVTQSRLGS